MSYLVISDNPEFTQNIEKFETSDPCHAAEFNKRMKVLVENEIALNRDKAGMSCVYDGVIQASSWQGENEPYTNAVQCEKVTNDNNVEIVPGILSLAEWEAMTDASIISGTQSQGVINLLAYGNKPEIDLPIKIIIRGD